MIVIWHQNCQHNLGIEMETSNSIVCLPKHCNSYFQKQSHHIHIFLKFCCLTQFHWLLYISFYSLDCCNHWLRSLFRCREWIDRSSSCIHHSENNKRQLTRSIKNLQLYASRVTVTKHGKLCSCRFFIFGYFIVETFCESMTMTCQSDQSSNYACSYEHELNVWLFLFHHSLLHSAGSHNPMAFVAVGVGGRRGKISRVDQNDESRVVEHPARSTCF